MTTTAAAVVVVVATHHPHPHPCSPQAEVEKRQAMVDARDEQNRARESAESLRLQVRAATELAEARRLAASQSADVVQNHLEALDLVTKEKVGLLVSSREDGGQGPGGQLLTHHLPTHTKREVERLKDELAGRQVEVTTGLREKEVVGRALATNESLLDKVEAKRAALQVETSELKARIEELSKQLETEKVVKGEMELR